MTKVLLVCCLSLRLCLTEAAIAAPVIPLNEARTWKAIEDLANNQKFQEALALTEKTMNEWKDGNLSPLWIKYLAKQFELEIGLHGFENALVKLKSQTWPSEESPQQAANLTQARIIFAHGLNQYAQNYSWEIRKREKVENSGNSGERPLKESLKLWTYEEIFNEAYETYLTAWKNRSRLRSLSNTLFKESVQINTYPAGIRDTARDTLAYLFSDLLANTLGWSPQESSSVYQLNLEALLESSSNQINGVYLPNSFRPKRKIHPLQALSLILLDHEAWHLAEGRPEAAFEARLQLYRHLKPHFTLPQENTKIRDHLRRHLKNIGENAWTPMAFALLSEMTDSTSEPNRKILAYEIAQKCAHNEYFGIREKTQLINHGKARCRDLMRSLELPTLTLEGMFIDGANRRTLVANYKNLNEIYFRSYRVDLVDRVESKKDYNLWLNYNDLKTILTRSHTYTWKTKLEPTRDYLPHKKFITPPSHVPGFYIVVASAKENFSRDQNFITGTQMLFSDYVLNYRQYPSRGEIEAQVLGGELGNPIEGAEVRLYHFDYKKGNSVASQGKTNSLGEVTLNSKPNMELILLAKIKDQWVLSRNSFYSSHYKVSGELHSELIYTDRSIYRPGQKILWKVVGYSGYTLEGKFHTTPHQTTTVSLKDTNGEIVESKAVQTNEFGTASGEFLIPTGKLLGQWQIVSSHSRHSGHSSIKVEEYKRPTFEVELEDSKSPLRLNQVANLTASAKYYFGQSLKSGFSKWKVTRTPVLPWWCLGGRWSSFLWGSHDTVEIVKIGGGKIPDDGKIQIEFTPKSDERKVSTLSQLNYNYSLFVDVTDEGGETRSVFRSYSIGFQSIQAQVILPTGFLTVAQKSSIKVLRTDLNFSPAPGSGSWKLARLLEPKDVSMPADQLPSKELLQLFDHPYSHADDFKIERWQTQYNPKLYLRSWEVDESKAALSQAFAGILFHDAKGEAELQLPGLSAGAYRLTYESKDNFGTLYKTQEEFLVANIGYQAALPAFLKLEKSTLAVGDKAKILAFTSRPNQNAMLEVFRNGHRIDRWAFSAKSAKTTIFEYPITEADRGGMGFTLTLVGDYQPIVLHETLIVPWSNKEIAIEFATFRDYLQAGGGPSGQAKEKWSIKVKAKDPILQEKVSMELLTYMYDKSLDAISPHNPRNPLSLYPIRSSVTPWIYGLGNAPLAFFNSSGFHFNPESAYLYNDYVKLGPVYGIGGVGGKSDSFLSGNRRGYLSNTGIAEGLSTAALPASSVVDEDAVSVKKLESRIDQNKDREKSAPTQNEGLRTSFSETAFWIPHLILDKINGTAEFEFSVPDSITSWAVWVHGITQDFRSASLLKTVKTAKDLLVRPYLPRFFREGDQVKIKIVLQNTTNEKKSGQFDLAIHNIETHKSMLEDFGLNTSDIEKRNFEIAPQGSTVLNFQLKIPKFNGNVSLKAYAKSGTLSDGELRQIPVLPGRFHLAQSKFITLKNKAKKEIQFKDLKVAASDPSLNHDQLVVTLDAQLFYMVLSSLPYLINYPYECTEQTLNRFLSSAVLSTLFQRFPAVAKMAETFSKRPTLLESFNPPDPNRKIHLEETPWLAASKGGGIAEKDLIKILDPRISSQLQMASLKQLEKSQSQTGGFPWFPGGPPSPYLTIYILYGFAKSLEFGVDLPIFTDNMIKKAWGYLHRHYLDEMVKTITKQECCWETITFLNYVVLNFKKIKSSKSWGFDIFNDSESRRMLDFSFKYWKQHSPYLKGYLALSLKGMDRNQDAKLVWDSVTDSLKISEEEGAHWVREDRSWLWYHDTIETHAFALRTSMEMGVRTDVLEGLVQWLFLNKKLNHWKSTRATSEVIYSLAHYLKKTNQLAVREDAVVSLGGQKHSFEFLPDQYSGKKNQVIVPGEKLNPNYYSIIIDKNTPGFLFASATWNFSTETLPKEAIGDFLNLKRKYYKRVMTDSEAKLIPVSETDDASSLEIGDEVEVHLTLHSKHALEYVHLRDPRPSGLEPTQMSSNHRYALGLYWYEEIKDSGTNFFFESLPQGEYPFKYRLRAYSAGHFKAFPATAQPLYAPEFAAYSAGGWIRIR